jgi:iron complex transport system substrate-binding protein
MRAAHGWLVVLVIILSTFQAAAAAPARIVSTFLCTDEYVFRLVPRERIAALSFEAGDRNPVVSTIADRVAGIPGIRPTTEAVLNYKPDLVVMYAGTQPRLHAQLTEIGVPILDVPWANSLADIRTVTRMLAARFGAHAEGEALLAQMDRTLASAQAHAVHPPVTALLYETNGYAAAGSVADELMAMAGLQDMAPKLGLNRVDRIPVETIVASAPELLIMNANESTRDAEGSLVLHHPAFAALRDKTLIVWRPLRTLLCPGPWSADAATTFSELGLKARALARARLQN